MIKKICLITGGTSGVGYATALGLARLGATVLIISRTEKNGSDTVQQLITQSNNKKIDFLIADLSEPDSIRDMVRTFKSRYNSLHVLSNNAACLTTKRVTNSRGYELVFASNYLSHFLLTHLLIDVLKKSAPSRILTVSGNVGLVKYGKIYFDDIHLEHSFNPLKATLQATFAKVLFSLELAKRIDGSGVTSNTFHPGFVRSRLGRNLPFPINLFVSMGMKVLPSKCASSVFLASDDSVEKLNGIFYENGTYHTFKSEHFTKDSVSRLWMLSTTLCDITDN